MPDFTDSSLSHRARNMALWLCDLANPVLDHKEASADMLLHELSDRWTADDLMREAREIRQRIGPKASHRAWLEAMGWLVGEEERLPPRPDQRMSEAGKLTARQILRDVLAKMGQPPAPRRDPEPAPATTQEDEPW